ncbi:MAG: OmpH family outer membrane protein, partial [Acidobacteria bacterium]|nr:OmpH family outer membrane protein [Acidobacteriota bacterium]
MRRLVLLAALTFAFAGVSPFAETSAFQTPPAQPPPAKPPAQPAPQPPAKPPAPQPTAKPQAPPPMMPAVPAAPFPEGAKIAFVDVQRIATESTEGKAATTKLDALRNKKTNELNEKNKALQANQQKLQQQSGVLSVEAQGQLQKEIEKQQLEIQRFTQDAQAEVQDLQQELQLEFQKKLFPIIGQVAVEKNLHMLFSQGDSGIIWAAPGL